MIVFLQNNKHLLIGVGVVAVVLFFVYKNWQPAATEVVAIESYEPVEIEEIEEPVENYTLPDMIFVEVKGAVLYPGVYELPADARVKNVLEKAVVQPEGDLLHVNQSMKLKDEQVVYVPFEDEADLIPNTYVNEYDSAHEVDNDLININTASIEVLMRLNGVGEKTAQSIIEYREQNGLFMNTADLMQVSGIGEKKFQNLEQHIVVE
ncbi:MAG TPA: ComEA family DNA-binding protein [Aliicoccus persicus]|uniref:ComEA family DNA-binding protein n=1 Tax=Aliicoccus persicus TaxID=930138 RepID=A0A921B5A6_9STAP|nr:ComEA family DNA-binding protein [Aliicoccus persicus]